VRVLLFFYIAVCRAVPMTRTETRLNWKTLSTAPTRIGKSVGIRVCSTALPLGVPPRTTAWDVRSWESMTTAFKEKIMVPENISVEDGSSAGVVSLFSWSAIIGAIATVFFV
jgi:hypothetical protein